MERLIDRESDILFGHGHKRHGGDNEGQHRQYRTGRTLMGRVPGSHCQYEILLEGERLQCKWLVWLVPHVVIHHCCGNAFCSCERHSTNERSHFRQYAGSPQLGGIDRGDIVHSSGFSNIGKLYLADIQCQPEQCIEFSDRTFR